MRVVGSHHDMVHSEELSQSLYANTDTYFTNGCDHCVSEIWKYRFC